MWFAVFAVGVGALIALLVYLFGVSMWFAVGVGALVVLLVCLVPVYVFWLVFRSSNAGWPSRDEIKAMLIAFLRELGGAALFSAIVGALSLLSLLENVTDYRLSPSLQWIVDYYHRLTALMALAVEPFVAPIIARINFHAGWHLVLYPHWRALFLIAMVFYMSIVRVMVREWASNVGGWNIESTLFIVCQIVCAFVGCLIAGLMPVEGRWWEQGLLATAPVLAFHIGILFWHKLNVAYGIVITVTSLAAYIFAARLSFVPGIEQGAGILTIAAFVGVTGLAILINGIYRFSSLSRRVGLSILGGFIIAGMIVGADAILKTRSSISLKRSPSLPVDLMPGHYTCGVGSPSAQVKTRRASALSGSIWFPTKLGCCSVSHPSARTSRTEARGATCRSTCPVPIE